MDLVWLYRGWFGYYGGDRYFGGENLGLGVCGLWGEGGVGLGWVLNDCGGFWLGLGDFGGFGGEFGVVLRFGWVFE